jgi:hypothetical protein
MIFARRGDRPRAVVHLTNPACGRLPNPSAANRRCVRLRQVVAQLRPAVCLGPIIETAGADELIIVLARDPPFGQLTRRPAGQMPLDHRFDHRYGDDGIAGQLRDGGILQVGVERGSVGHPERAQARSVELERRWMVGVVDHGFPCRPALPSDLTPRMELQETP